MDPNDFSLAEKDGTYSIKIGDSDRRLKTPVGRPLTSDNKNLVEAIISELQDYSEVSIEDEAVGGEPLERMSLISLLATQIVFCSDGSPLGLEDIVGLVNGDPVTNFTPAPDLIEDHVNQWRPIINYLRSKKYGLSSGELTALCENILLDLDNAAPYERSIFVNMTHMFDSPTSSWGFTFGNFPLEEAKEMFSGGNVFLGDKVVSGVDDSDRILNVLNNFKNLNQKKTANDD